MEGFGLDNEQPPMAQTSRQGQEQNWVAEIACAACSLLLATACSGRMAYDDTQSNNGANASAVGGAAYLPGGATNGGGPAGKGGAGSAGSSPASAGGTEAANVNCTTVDLPKLLGQAPVCTFPPIDHPEATDCQSSTVSVYVEQTVTYVISPNVSQCAEHPTESVELDHVGKAYRNSMEEIVTGQVLDKGLVRLTCTSGNGEGYHWSYNVTCSPNSLQTIQPYLKSGNLYVEFPEGEVGPAGYEGLLVSYYTGASDATIAYTSKSGEHTPLGTEPVAYSMDHTKLWFKDLSGRQVTIVLDDEYRVIDIQRQ